MNKRITVRYEGHVQGVGFRFTAVNLAQHLNITGWVKNEFDGSVLMVAEGEEEELMKFIQTLQRSHLGKYITRERVRNSSTTGEFKRFDVIY